MLGKVKNKLIAVFAAVLLACGGIAAANLVNAPEEPSVFESQEFIWVSAETAEVVSTESSDETEAVQAPYLEIYKINLNILVGSKSKNTAQIIFKRLMVQPEKIPTIPKSDN